MAKTPKPFVYPKSQGPINPAAKAVPLVNQNKILRQFATKPVVKPAKVSSRSLTRAPADPLNPPNVPIPAVKPKIANPLAPLKTYLP